MGYQVFVLCDLADCGARVEVQQQGMMPVGWIAVKAVKVNLNLRAMPVPAQNQLMEDIKIFCGPRCVVKYFKSQLAGGDN